MRDLTELKVIMADRRPTPLELESCEYCGIGRLCLSAQLVGGDLQTLKPVVERRFGVRRRQRLYELGARQQALYVVKAGTFKTCEIDADGDEQVLDFYLPGDVLGLEDLSTQRHESDAVALEDSWICAMPVDRMHQGPVADAVMLREMFAVVCRKLSHQREIIHRLGKADATARLAHFLLELSNRFERRHLPGDRFRLPMDRTDIASYLRTTLETVSRSFTTLQQEGCVDVRAKSVAIIDHQALQERAAVG